MLDLDFKLCFEFHQVNPLFQNIADSDSVKQGDELLTAFFPRLTLRINVHLKVFSANRLLSLKALYFILYKKVL